MPEKMVAVEMQALVFIQFVNIKAILFYGLLVDPPADGDAKLVFEQSSIKSEIQEKIDEGSRKHAGGNQRRHANFIFQESPNQYENSQDGRDQQGQVNRPEGIHQ